MTVLHSRRGWNARKFASRFLQYLILSLVVVIVFVPVVILIFGALKTRGEFMTRPYALPIPPRWENITGILTKASYSFWPMLRNSMIVMLIVTCGGAGMQSRCFRFCPHGIPLQGLGIQLIYVGTHVPYQRRHFAGVFCIAPDAFDR